MRVGDWSMSIGRAEPKRLGRSCPICSTLRALQRHQKISPFRSLCRSGPRRLAQFERGSPARESGGALLPVRPSRRSPCGGERTCHGIVEYVDRRSRSLSAIISIAIVIVIMRLRDFTSCARGEPDPTDASRAALCRPRLGLPRSAMSTGVC